MSHGTAKNNFNDIARLRKTNLQTCDKFKGKVKGKGKGRGKGKGKAIPLQPWTFPEGSWKLRLPDLKTVGT
jgi:hypothetical protein